MFHISEERINKAKANNYYCEKVTDELPEDLLKELKNLSKESVIKVPIRHKGITSCEPLMCYWNSNVISQTFGGMPVYGWIVNHAIKDGIRTEGLSKGVKYKEVTDKTNHYTLTGHGVWLTPEGKLVDVTRPNDGEDPDKSFRYFLPSNKLLKLNSKDEERIRDFDYTDCPNTVKKLISDNCGSVSKGVLMRMFIDMGKTDEFYEIQSDSYACNFLFEESFDFEKYTNKIIDPYGFPKDFPLDDVLKEKLNWSDDEIRKVFSPHMNVVTESTCVIKRSRFGLHPIELAKEAKRLNKNLFEINQDIDWERAFVYQENTRITRTTGHGSSSSVVGISTTNGKSIYEIPPKAEVIEKNELPRNKKRRRKVEKKAKNSVFSPQELLTLNNEFLFPHPYLTLKNGFEPIVI